MIDGPHRLISPRERGVDIDDLLEHCFLVKITKTFQRNLKTSRRFVFENVFDLDHVCVLHKRWFRHLRIIKQTPEYVEYRLQSLFYGLKQDTLVKGAPINQNRYWYEFLTPIARMRVEGSMQGADGDLTLTEVYNLQLSLGADAFILVINPSRRNACFPPRTSLATRASSTYMVVQFRDRLV